MEGKGQSKPVAGGKIVDIPRLNQWSLYEKVCYGLDVLVPDEESGEMFVPADHILQKVHIGEKKKWRVVIYSKAGKRPIGKFTAIIRRIF
jgi:hypothetical protein